MILPGPAEEELWLDGELDDALELLRPLDASRVSLAPANLALNKVGGARERRALLVAHSCAVSAVRHRHGQSRRGRQARGACPFRAS